MIESDGTWVLAQFDKEQDNKKLIYSNEFRIESKNIPKEYKEEDKEFWNDLELMILSVVNGVLWKYGYSKEE